MIPFRTQVKIFLDNADSIDVAVFSGIFQRWIQQKALDGLLIDVADYRHVYEGPNVVLIGYDADYTIERRDGRLGLLFTRKRQTDPDLATQLRVSLRRILAAATLLEAEPDFEPRLKFRTDEIEIRFADRLQLPNTPDSFALVKDDLQTVIAALYGSDAATIAPVTQDERLLFTVVAHGDGAASMSDLAQHLQASVEK